MTAKTMLALDRLLAVMEADKSRPLEETTAIRELRWCIYREQQPTKPAPVIEVAATVEKV